MIYKTISSVHFHFIFDLLSSRPTVWRLEGTAKHTPPVGTIAPVSAGALVLKLSLQCGYDRTDLDGSDEAEAEAAPNDLDSDDDLLSAAVLASDFLMSMPPLK